MLVLLRDGVWQFFGAFFTILGIFATIWIYRKQKQRKELTYKLISSSPILGVRGKITGELRIIHNNRAVNQLQYIKLRVTNSGNVAIRATDFETPLVLSVKKGEILSADLADSTPNNIGVHIQSISASEVVIPPLLLNAGDQFDLELLVNDYSGGVTLAARIENVKEIVLIEKNWNYYLDFLLVPIVGWTTTVVVTLSFLKYHNLIETASYWSFIGNILGAIAGFSFTLYSINKSRSDDDI